MDVRKGIVISNTNLIDSKKEAPFPWVGMLLVIFMNLACYVGAFYFQYSTQKKVSELKGQIESVRQGRDYKKIASVADVESRLATAKVIIGQRTNWGKFFTELEKNTLPDIVFNSMEVQKQDQAVSGLPAVPGASSDPVYIAELRGTTVGIENLSKQVASFREVLTDKEKPFAKEVNIGKIDIKKTDVIEEGSGKSLDFSLRININPEILKTSLEKTSASAGASKSTSNVQTQNAQEGGNNNIQQ